MIELDFEGCIKNELVEQAGDPPDRGRKWEQILESLAEGHQVSEG